MSKSYPVIVRTLCVAAGLLAAARVGAAAPLPRVYHMDPQAVAHLRATVRHRGAPTPGLARLLARADGDLSRGPFTIMNKAVTPPSGSKHDYLSQAPYFWPNPRTRNGLPYVRHDGRRNPEIYRITDHRELDQVESCAGTLALAWYLTGKQEYAAHATALLRAFFLDAATRMNPNLEYAQGIPGINTGRSIGIIETAGLPAVTDAIGLLAGSKSWTAADQQGMVQWMKAYLHWLRTSAHGQQESRARNNHGTYYDMQVVDLALFTGNRALASKVLLESEQKRIARQILPDGEQPLETARTRSWGYSLMNLRGLFLLAELGDRAGVNLWDFKTSDGRSIRKALDWMLPYALGEKRWPYRNMVPLNPRGLAPLLLVAARHWHDAAYSADARKLGGVNRLASRLE